jgi:hypothetical protein
MVSRLLKRKFNNIHFSKKEAAPVAASFFIQDLRDLTRENLENRMVSGV